MGFPCHFGITKLRIVVDGKNLCLVSLDNDIKRFKLDDLEDDLLDDINRDEQLEKIRQLCGGEQCAAMKHQLAGKDRALRIGSQERLQPLPSADLVSGVAMIVISRGNH